MKIITILFLFFLFPLSANSQDEKYHTRPTCWDEVRTYHQLGKIDYAPKLKPTQENSLKLSDNITISPNKVYAYSQIENSDETVKSLLIFTERSYLIKLDLLDSDFRYGPEVRWVNEKLIFIRVWISQIMGYDVIFDVEKEKVISTETFIFGKIDFQQWQAGCQNKTSKNDTLCQKECIDIENFK